MSSGFAVKLFDAVIYLEANEPFWCDDYLRPKSEDFTNFLRDSGFDIYYLFFPESGEGVYSPWSYNPNELKATAKWRSELREQGVAEDDLPTSLKVLQSISSERRL